MPDRSTILVAALGATAAFTGMVGLLYWWLGRADLSGDDDMTWDEMRMRGYLR